MKIPPLWKVARELKRPFQQLPSLPGQLGTYFFGARFYDTFMASQVKQTAGNFPRGNRVAIYLIFPQNGLLPSHKMALNYIIENGYAPFVVSNVPIANTDMEYLRANSWRVLERPNVGYDFGGYRDGFLSLGDDIDELSRLVFLNDSSWFPLPGSENWLQQAEALNVDYAAAASSFGIPRVKPDEYQNICWKFDPTLRNFHYTSYALSVGSALLQREGYQRYWRSYPLTKDKNKVVRRGEIGMTRFALRSGSSHGSTYEIQSLPGDLKNCSDAEINRFAKGMTYLDDMVSAQTMAQELPHLDAARSPADRDKLIQLMLAVSARIGISYVLSDFLYQKHGFTFLKKSLASINRENSDRVYAFAKTLEGPEGAVILQEIEEIRARKGY